jgi:hypothetical protein
MTKTSPRDILNVYSFHEILEEVEIEINESIARFIHSMKLESNLAKCLFLGHHFMMEVRDSGAFTDDEIEKLTAVIPQMFAYIEMPKGNFLWKYNNKEKNG